VLRPGKEKISDDGGLAVDDGANATELEFEDGSVATVYLYGDPLRIILEASGPSDPQTWETLYPEARMTAKDTRRLIAALSTAASRLESIEN
jgi:hypothetical protein